MTEKTTLDLEAVEARAEKALVSYSHAAAILIKHNIPALIAEVRRLREALKPFASLSAQIADHADVSNDAEIFSWVARSIRFGDVRNASAVLSDQEKKV